jgi:MFS family permease
MASRMFCAYAIDFYMPTYFMQTYPKFTNEFSVLMSIIVVSCGVMSSLIGGYLADKYSQKSHSAYSNICVAGSLLAFPFFTLAVLQRGNFWLAMVCIAMKYLLGECFWAPNIAMIQNSVPQNKFSTIFGAINFFVLISGCLSTFIFGQLVNYLNCA